MRFTKIYGCSLYFTVKKLNLHHRIFVYNRFCFCSRSKSKSQSDMMALTEFDKDVKRESIAQSPELESNETVALTDFDGD